MYILANKLRFVNQSFLHIAHKYQKIGKNSLASIWRSYILATSLTSGVTAIECDNIEVPVKMPAVGPPTPAGEAALEAFLTHPSRPEGTLSLGQVRGFLFAVAAAPDLVQPSEWVPCIFAGEEPEFENMDEVQRIMGTLLSLYNEANDVVQTEGERQPRGCTFREDLLSNLEPDAEVSLWSRGFVAGHTWLEESWEPYMIEAVEEEMGAVLTTLSFFASRSTAEELLRESGRPEASLEEAAAKFRSVFPDAVTGYAQVGMVIRRAVHEADRHREEAKGKYSGVGRNQPCPCGSGKKYKRCCGLPSVGG
jgi:uncharacterized protein